VVALVGQDLDSRDEHPLLCRWYVPSRFASYVNHCLLSALTHPRRAQARSDR
jgi:hypothetical protein